MHWTCYILQVYVSLQRTMKVPFAPHRTAHLGEELSELQPPAASRGPDSQIIAQITWIWRETPRSRGWARQRLYLHQINTSGLLLSGSGKHCGNACLGSLFFPSPKSLFLNLTYRIVCISSGLPAVSLRRAKHLR